MAQSISHAERQVTHAAHGHILTNVGVWSPDSQWIVYDVRSDAAGEVFDGQRIERVHVDSGEVEILYESKHGAACGVVTHSPTSNEAVFIHGPENPTDDWKYAAYHRRGVRVPTDRSGVESERRSLAENLDARDIVPPFTAGALRGGTHVHTYSGDGKWIAFTYEDHHLATADPSTSRDRDLNQRNVGVSVPIRSVKPAHDHPRNHAGSHFTVLVTRTVNEPAPGSDEISKAFSDAWVGQNGYVRLDGARQRRAIAFQGHVRTKQGETLAEVFIVDLPEDVTVPQTVAQESRPLQGTEATRPWPPRGTLQRRLTRTDQRKFPGIQGVRHWLRSSPDGSMIAFLMRDDAGVSQLWTISPNGGAPKQVTHNAQDISSAFTWSPDGKSIAHTMYGSICQTDVATGTTARLTAPRPAEIAPRPEACVFSPDGKRIAVVCPTQSGDRFFNQIFVVERSFAGPRK